MYQIIANSRLFSIINVCLRQATYMILQESYQTFSHVTNILALTIADKLFN